MAKMHLKKLTYWVAEHLSDSPCYNIRETTKKAVVAVICEHWNPSTFSKPRKVSVEYTNAFDLMDLCMGEGRGYWELSQENLG